MEVAYGLHRRAAGGGEFRDIFWCAGGGVDHGAVGGDPGAAGFEGGEDGADVALLHRPGADFQPGPRYHAHHAVSVFVWVSDVDDLGAGQGGEVGGAAAVASNE